MRYFSKLLGAVALTAALLFSATSVAEAKAPARAKAASAQVLASDAATTETQELFGAIVTLNDVSVPGKAVTPPSTTFPVVLVLAGSDSTGIDINVSVGAVEENALAPTRVYVIAVLKGSDPITDPAVIKAGGKVVSLNSEGVTAVRVPVDEVQGDRVFDVYAVPAAN